MRRSHCTRYRTTALDALTHDIGRHQTMSSKLSFCVSVVVATYDMTWTAPLNQRVQLQRHRTTSSGGHRPVLMSSGVVQKTNVSTVTHQMINCGQTMNIGSIRKRALYIHIFCSPSSIKFDRVTDHFQMINCTAQPHLQETGLRPN